MIGYTILACVIGALAGLVVHLTRERAYWKNKAMAEARKRLQKDNKAEKAHRAEAAGLRQTINRQSGRIVELERNNNVLRHLNEQLTRHHEGGTL